MYGHLNFSFTNSFIKSYKYKDTNGVLRFASGQIVDGWENILVKYHFQVALFLQFYPGIHSLKAIELNAPWICHGMAIFVWQPSTLAYLFQLTFPSVMQAGSTRDTLQVVQSMHTGW